MKARSFRCTYRPLLLAALLFADSGLSAPAEDAKKSPSRRLPVCYETVVSSDASEIARIIFDPDSLNMRVEFKGATKTPFFSAGGCTRGTDGAISCQVDCDGGKARIAPSATGAKLKAMKYSLNLALTSALPFSMEPDSGTLDGTFDLKPVDASVCINAFNSSTFTGGDLQRGDFSPVVRRIKTYLADMGLLDRRPDWYFDNATEAAVRAFQKSIGLPASGVLDTQTIAKLRLVSVLNRGC